MPRLAWYAGASAVLAAGVVASAFHQRANFYSAMVHLAQSSLSLMILVNLIFLIYASFMYGLQRLCFGQLRPVEIEQLYEKGWFAVTETCLAMTIFREEVGAFFLVMFTALVTGKVWGWIGDGRVEVLEQQPPANPRLFHARLSISLILSFAYDLWLLNYAVNTVVQQARPTMMVMFLFEFAVLTVSSFHTGCRYIISLIEARVIKQQTAKRLEDRRRQVREQRAEILRRRETEGVTETETEAAEPLPSEDDIDEMDIEVPGWESKGQYVLCLDLLADFIKMSVYTSFFFVLFTFYGLPIHIMRDVFMTTRSFVKRLNALIRYRQALKDMNLYPDATAEELGREDTCIICREEMHPWDAANPGQVERSRPKKLPCGHILHFGCLKSWLERQQVCPTCRRSVEAPAPNADENGMVFRFGLNFPARNQGQQAPADGVAPGNAQGAQGAQVAQGGRNGRRNARNNVRMFNLGPIRLGFAQGQVADLQDMAQQLRDPANAANRPAGTEQIPIHDQNTHGGAILDEIRDQLADINHRVVEAGQRVQQDMQQLQNAEAQLLVMNLLLQEMARLNHVGQAALQQHQRPQTQPNATSPNPAEAAPPAQPQPAIHIGAPHQQHGQAPPPVFQPFQPFPNQYGQFLPMAPANNPFVARAQTPAYTRHGAGPSSAVIPAGSPDLPEGVVLPPGWSLLPLQRMEQPGPGQLPVPAAPQVHIPRPATTPANSGEVNGQVVPSGGVDVGSSREQQAPPLSDMASTLLSRLLGDQNGAVAGPSSRPAPGESTEPAQRGRSPPVPSVTTQQPQSQQPQPQQSQPAGPQVTAPIPVLPNWGGSAQLFGGGNSGTREASAADLGLGQPSADAPSTQSPAGQEDKADREDVSKQHGSSNGQPTVDKGKGRAVTVEDDDSGDDA